MPEPNTTRYQPLKQGRFKDLTDNRYGRLTVLEFSHIHIQPDGKRTVAHWKCVCACGTLKTIAGSHLRSGWIRSCGCLMREKSARLNFKAGFSRKDHPNYYLLHLWQGIIQRCYSKTYRHYDDWGGRGIRIAEQWRHDSTAFVTDILDLLGHRPSSVHSLDRYPDMNGNYEPNNLRWATDAEQNRNTRRNRFITAGGRTQCLTDWAKELSRNPRTISARIDELRWSEEEAVEVIQRTKVTSRS